MGVASVNVEGSAVEKILVRRQKVPESREGTPAGLSELKQKGYMAGAHSCAE